MIEELGGRIDLIGKIAVREVDEFIDEVIPPFGISRQPYALTDDTRSVCDRSRLGQRSEQLVHTAASTG